MHPIQWLEGNADGFRELSEPERAALMHFALLWSYFEAQALQANASAGAISAWIRRLDEEHKLNTAVFSLAIRYFKARYFHVDDFTAHYHSLNLRQNDYPDLVRGVLSGVNDDPVDSAVVLFIIIYRLRNNYFHGPKWAYHLQGQLDNFNAANDSLMRAVEMWRA